jgi:putative zinc finger/helix-turn-helix YgiT family protein
MTCLNCSNEEFIEKCQSVPQVFRGESLTVAVPAMVCTECGWVTMTDAQADQLCRVTADEYRRKHNLLTGPEIVALRKSFNMSQQKFADYIGAGEASVKRWENAGVQEPIYDARIREKCLPAPVKAMVGVTVTARRQFVSFEITKELGSVAEIPYREANVIPLGMQTESTTFNVTLSDGNRWRQEHSSTDDVLSAAA